MPLQIPTDQKGVVMPKYTEHADFSFTLGGFIFHISNIGHGLIDYAIPNHNHSKNSYEIHYVTSGHGHAYINGGKYEILPGILYVTGPCVEHAQIPSPDKPICEYCIYLKIEGRSPCSDSAEKALVKHFRQTTFWVGTDSQNISSLLRELFSELANRHAGYFVYVESLLKQFVIKLLRNYECKPEIYNRTVSPGLIDNKYLTIEKCFLDEYTTLTLEDLAVRLGLSTRQTERLLKEHYGRTFLQKKMEARMSASILLLQNPKLTITQIAEKTGYSCVEHFSASFKRYYGQSASDYRKRTDS